jgi:hypothetical protein
MLSLSYGTASGHDVLMPPKYDPLQRRLEEAPADEPVSLTFDEISALVGGLPPSSSSRMWWANTTNENRSQAKSWLATSRRVTEVRLGDTVVFSPADAVIEVADAARPSRPRGLDPIMDGVEALSAVLIRAGFSSVPAAVAAHARFLHPDTVVQTRGQPLFRTVRDPGRRGVIGQLHDGTEVMYDDNQTPALAFMWAAQRIKGPDVQLNHLWGDPKNPATYTALWNMCATPAFLAKTTDGSNHPEVLALLRYRAFDLFGHSPEGEERPSKPGGYDTLTWLAHPDPVPNLEAVLRSRLAAAPKSRAAASAKRLGWLFSDWGPDDTLA